MNRPVLAGVLGGFISGAGVGFLIGVQAVERHFQKKYEESQKALIGALERQQHTINQYIEAPALLEEHLIDAANTVRDQLLESQDAQTEGPVVVSSMETAQAKVDEAFAGAQGEEAPPEYINHYAKAIAATETGHELFVSGGVNDYGVSYIEEDDYDEDDGRFKGQIAIVMDEHNPSFFMDGVQINDWAERVGDSILVDFYQLVPPNAPPILYVRNHKRDEDYEVTREIP